MSQENDVPFEENRPQTQTPAPLIPPALQPCPECHSEMVEGWVPEYTDQAGAVAISSWQPGPPHTSPGLFHTVRIHLPNPKEAIPIRTFRCVRCGFLKFYARAAG